MWSLEGDFEGLGLARVGAAPLPLIWPPLLRPGEALGVDPPHVVLSRRPPREQLRPDAFDPGDDFVLDASQEGGRVPQAGLPKRPAEGLSVQDAPGSPPSASRLRMCPANWCRTVRNADQRPMKSSIRGKPHPRSCSSLKSQGQSSCSRASRRRKRLTTRICMANRRTAVA